DVIAVRHVLLGAVDQFIEDQAPDAGPWNADSSELRIAILSQVDVVEPSYRDVSGNGQAAFTEGTQDSDRHEVIRTDDGSRTESAGEEFLTGAPPALEIIRSDVSAH